MKLLLLLALIWGQNIYAGPNRYAEVVKPQAPLPPVGRVMPPATPADELPQLEEMNTAPNPLPDVQDDKNIDQTLDAGKARAPSSTKEKKDPHFNTSPDTRTSRPLGPNKK